ncbi:helix-turn-helix domain-containing protein [Saccharothrix syringae]|uniref:helix-turn-helix domain-containing protein n=1 Tax=Saccharothrix syringae TaxID=103733 RepID=UPI001D177C13|nr:helix-turn-helix transcriptional regulator [Saccharothrix syringae]
MKSHRQRVGMSRPVLAALVGRSAEWLKAVENGRLQPPRLPVPLRLAHALDLSDLPELTGNGHAVPVRVFAGQRHPALTDGPALDIRSPDPDRRTPTRSDPGCAARCADPSW